MTEKKKEEKTKKAAAKKVVLPPKTKAKVLVKEDVYPAIEIAKLLGISDYAFLMIKKAAGINDGTLLTITEFKTLRQQKNNR